MLSLRHIATNIYIFYALFYCSVEFVQQKVILYYKMPFLLKENVCTYIFLAIFLWKWHLWLFWTSTTCFKLRILFLSFSGLVWKFDESFWSSFWFVAFASHYVALGLLPKLYNTFLSPIQRLATLWHLPKLSVSPLVLIWSQFVCVSDFQYCSPPHAVVLCFLIASNLFLGSQLTPDATSTTTNTIATTTTMTTTTPTFLTIMHQSAPFKPSLKVLFIVFLCPSD